MADNDTNIQPVTVPEASRNAGGEGFVARWSRVKAEARESPAEKPRVAPADPQDPPPDLPPLEQLTFDSDYRQFFHPAVGADVRRAALKKLFSDPHFNVMDGLDVYIDDYSKAEPIPAAMLASLRQAQNIFQWAKEDADERRRAEARVDSAPPETETGQAALDVPKAQPDAADVLGVKDNEAAPISTSEIRSKTRS